MDASVPGQALVIIPFFGVFGPWFPLYLRSLAQQSTLDLLLITDVEVDSLPRNVRLLRMNLADLERHAEMKLGSSVKLPTPRHLCDLKPAYGRIFEDYLAGYKYWAFGDEDVLYGDLDRLLAPLLERDADVVVPGNESIGHLTLLRNSQKVIDLVFEDPEYETVMSAEEFWAYDETSWARITECGSFTKTIKTAKERGEISTIGGYQIRGDVPRPGTGIMYDGKSIFTEKAGQELTYYHWGRAKTRGHRFPSISEAERGFGYDSYGFYDPQFPGYASARRRVGTLHQDCLRVRRFAGKVGSILGSGGSSADRRILSADRL